MATNKEEREKERILRVAYEALDECNKIHESTGEIKIPLDEVSKNLGISKLEIQESFDYLVQEGVIGDDNDRENMNYNESGELSKLIYQLLLAAREKQRARKEKKEREVVQYLE